MARPRPVTSFLFLWLDDFVYSCLTFPLSSDLDNRYNNNNMKDDVQVISVCLF